LVRVGEVELGAGVWIGLGEDPVDLAGPPDQRGVRPIGGRVRGGAAGCPHGGRHAVNPTWWAPAAPECLHLVARSLFGFGCVQVGGPDGSLTAELRRTAPCVVRGSVAVMSVERQRTRGS